jgi:sulfite reductase (NADPH) flavoprotein alpha-component
VTPSQPAQSLVASVCPYCGVGCGLLLEVAAGKVVRVQGDKSHPSNQGRLCTKGASSAQVLDQPDRMASAYQRPTRDEAPQPLPMAEAIAQTAARLCDIRDRHGPDALSFYVSGQMSTEAQYLVNKLAKGFIRTNNIESNSRLCMASAGTGYKLSLGSDAPPGSYDDFDHTDLFLVMGANMADCHPILYLRMMDRVKAGAKLIVVDPRRTTTAEKADLYLPIRPGSDLALLNGLLFGLQERGALDADFIAQHTQGWEDMPAFLADYHLDAVAQMTGLDPTAIAQAADWLAQAPAFITCWTMGLNQSTHGTWNTNAICNLHLATGQIGRVGAGPFSLTGQPNAMGGREMGYMGPGLPGQRSLLVAQERADVEQLWGVPPGSIATTLGKGTVDLFERLAAGDVKACWIICTNPVASVPNRAVVIEGLKRAEWVIAQDAFFTTETNAYADMLLPGALWAEAEGVMVNSERNLSLMQAAVAPPGEAMADWQIIAQVACAMGYAQAFSYKSAEDVFNEIRQFYNPKTGWDWRGASYARLREGPLQWPLPPEAAPRNPIRYLNTGQSQPQLRREDGSLPQLRFATDSGRAVFFPRPHLPPAEMPDAHYPFMLNTGRLQHQWHTLTKTGKLASLNKLNPGPFIEVHPEDAQALGITQGMAVAVRSRRGKVLLAASVTDRVLRGTCFAPIHWNDCYGEALCINAVTSDYVDPLSQQPELKVCAVHLEAQPERLVALSFETPAASSAAPPLLAMGEQPAPVFDASQQSYLAGFFHALAEHPPQGEVPMLPEQAPFDGAARQWLNGLLAGRYSRRALAPEAPPISLFWASQTGNAEALAHDLGARLGAQGWQVQLLAMNQIPLAQLQQLERAIFITSTFGDGDAPDNGAEFWRQLASSTETFPRLQFALLALGDSNYQQFCGFGRRLFERLCSLGAQPWLERCDCDTDYQTPFESWVEELLARLPAPSFAAPQGAALVSGSAAIAAAKPFSKAAPLMAPLVLNQRLNRLGASKDGASKDTRLIGFDLGDSGLRYQPGDALGIKPQNCPELVEEILKVTGLHSGQPVRLGADDLPLGKALQQHLEIARPSKNLLQHLAERAPESDLAQLVRPEHQNALASWLYGRQTVDLLAQSRTPWQAQDLVDLLRPLQPRLYSIASSQRQYPQQVHLCVAGVRYFFGDKPRKGVSSCFLADRAETVPIFLQPTQHFRLPANPDAPVIMIGPGTGVAPFRGFLQERAALGARGRNWLFFGEQHEATDFYCRDEWLAHQHSGLLTRLSLAFSRDQAEKIYVQQRILQAAAELYAWIQDGAYIYICGDASRMAKDVEKALIEVCAAGQGGDGDKGAELLRDLTQQGRYLRDVY